MSDEEEETWLELKVGVVFWVAESAAVISWSSARRLPAAPHLAQNPKSPIEKRSIPNK